MTNGSIIDKTEEAQKMVDENISITPYLLGADIDRTQIKRYFYLDSITLKEEEIPANGITINDS